MGLGLAFEKVGWRSCWLYE